MRREGCLDVKVRTGAVHDHVGRARRQGGAAPRPLMEAHCAVRAGRLPFQVAHRGGEAEVGDRFEGGEPRAEVQQTLSTACRQCTLRSRLAARGPDPPPRRLGRPESRGGSHPVDLQIAHPRCQREGEVEARSEVDSRGARLTLDTVSAAVAQGTDRVEETGPSSPVLRMISSPSIAPLNAVWMLHGAGMCRPHRSPLAPRSAEAGSGG